MQVVECLERWEYRIQEQKHVRQVMQYRIKDMILAGDHEKDHGVLFNEFLRLYLLSKGEFEKMPFDPANPTDKPFIMFGDDQSDWVFDRIDPWQPHHYEKLIAEARVQFDDMLVAEFPDYRSPVEPDVQTNRSQCEEGIRYTIPNITDNNRARWENHPLWEIACGEMNQDLFEMRSGCDPNPAKEVIRERHISVLLPNIKGCCVTLAALYGKSVEQLPEFFRTIGQDMADDVNAHPEFAAKQLQNAADRYVFLENTGHYRK